MEPHYKDIGNRSKDVAKKSSTMAKEMQAYEKLVAKVSKKGQSEFVEEMKRFNKKKDELDIEKAKILEEVFLFERARFCFVVEVACGPIKACIAMGNMLASLNEFLPAWEAKGRENEAFTVRP